MKSCLLVFHVCNRLPGVPVCMSYIKDYTSVHKTCVIPKHIMLRRACVGFHFSSTRTKRNITSLCNHLQYVAIREISIACQGETFPTTCVNYFITLYSCVLCKSCKTFSNVASAGDLVCLLLHGFVGAASLVINYSILIMSEHI